MTPINNSDTAWLIISDYNQDNNLPYIDLKEDINNPEIDQWMYNYYNFSAPIGGDSYNGSHLVGYRSGDVLGFASLGGTVGWALCDEGQRVGGN